MNNNHTILIVDDEKTNVQYVSNLLKDTYNIKVAFNGKQALNIVNNLEIHLILLDIQMPVMDGYEVIKELKSNSNTSEIPVIFLTSSKDDDTLIKVFELGAHDYITKPFNKEELKARIINHLSRYFLQKKSNEQQVFLDLLINSQSHMIFLANSKSIQFINKYALDFFNFENLDQFKEHHNSINDLFLKNDDYFHFGKIPENKTYVEAIKELASEDRLVSIFSVKENKNKVFKINIDDFDNNEFYIITFLDISETISKQFELEYKSSHDPLTLAYNREYFNQNYKSIIHSDKLKDLQTAIAIIDIDHFKIVNDTYGHDIGDEVLKFLVKIIKKNLRQSDTLIRWGGEEFVLLLAIKDIEGLGKKLESIRELIKNTNFDIIGNISVSIGASIHNINEKIEDTIKRADIALYDSKNNGRDLVTIK